MLDIRIINGEIVDGSGAARVRADVGIRNGKIEVIGNLSDAQSAKTIDASGMIVAPGFIDMHTHSDVSMLLDDSADSMLRNGVTTNVCGNCGEGVVPIGGPYREAMVKYMRSSVIPGLYPDNFEYPWSTMAEYHDYIQCHPPMINMASLIPHGPVRMSLMGMEKGAADAEQTRQMKALVREGMEAGAFGLSTGLAYSPGDLVGVEELTNVSRPLQPYGGVYATHLRNQGEGIYDSLNEAAAIGRGAGIPIHISHLKLADPKMWGRTEELFGWFEKTNASGLRATFDVYPYTLGCSTILRILPPWSKEGGVKATVQRLSDPVERAKVLHDCRFGIPGWENLAENIGWENVILTSFTKPEHLRFDGMNVREIADALGRDPWEVCFDLTIGEEGKIGILVASMSEHDMEQILCHPDAIVVSDGASQSLVASRLYGFNHPRAYGTQTKLLRRFVREKKLLDLEEAVRKMTSMPAEVLGMKGRGLLAEGSFADVVVFDSDNVTDTSTFSALQSAPTGIRTVIVNGVIALQDGQVLNRSSGRLIQKN